MPNKKRPEWDFDATPPMESNRRIPPDERECLCCGHVHRNMGAAILRCWTQIVLPSGRRRACKCRIFNGLQAGATIEVIGPFWGSNRGPWAHVWHYEREHRYTAWTLCGREARTEKVHAGYEPWQVNYRCRTCLAHPLAARASDLSVRWEKVKPPVRLSTGGVMSVAMTLSRTQDAFSTALSETPRAPDKLSKLCVRYQTALYRYQEVLRAAGQAAEAELKRWHATNAEIPKDSKH